MKCVICKKPAQYIYQGYSFCEREFNRAKVNGDVHILKSSTNVLSINIWDFEIDDSKNKEIVECFCKEPDDTFRCFHEGPCSPKGSILSGEHCKVCAGWHGGHKKGCNESRLPGDTSYKIIIHK